MSTPFRSQINYDIDLRYILLKVYRGSVMDLMTYEEFTDRLIYKSSIRMFSKNVCLFLSYGFNYLTKSEKSDFVDLVTIHDDEDDPFRDYNLAVDYFMSTASLYFHALIAYELLSYSDIEDYMNKPNFKLVDVYSGLLVFEYEEY